jgi:hypothetical protein
MCITLEPAKLSSTRIYAGDVTHPSGRPVHVIGYQNVVQATRGPNAMLLPFPASQVGPENLVNGAAFAEIMAAYERAIQRRNMTKGVSRGIGAAPAAAGYSVFDSGSYTIALAEKASFLKDAVQLVPEARRPKIATSFIIALSQLYPNWPIAVCCFEGGDVAPEPLFWWFESRYPDTLFAPAIDAHDGNPPNMGELVHRDHVVAFGSDAGKVHHDEHLDRDIRRIVPAEHQWMFSRNVTGKAFQGETRNGDFACSAKALRGSTESAYRARTELIAPPAGGAWGL